MGWSDEPTIEFAVTVALYSSFTKNGLVNRGNSRLLTISSTTKLLIGHQYCERLTKLQQNYLFSNIVRIQDINKSIFALTK